MLEIRLCRIPAWDERTDGMVTRTDTTAASSAEPLEDLQSQAFLDDIFACLARGQHFERIAGGSQTDVYCTGDQRYVVKLKSQRGGTLRSTLAQAHAMWAAAEQFAASLGPRHSIPSIFVVAREHAGALRVLVIQPFVRNARPLSAVDEQALPADERMHLAQQLHAIACAALKCFRATGRMPDLYGSFSVSTADRLRLNAPTMWPRRAWTNLAQQSLLRSHNLVLTATPERRVVLVDYDPVRWRGARGFINEAVRWMLIWRDHMRLHAMLVRVSQGAPHSHT
jgi:hypothetical protein